MSRMTPSLSFKTKIFKDFIYLDRGEGREKVRERNISVWLPLTHPLLGTWPPTQARARDRESNQQPIDLLANAHSIEPHQPGPSLSFMGREMAFAFGDWNSSLCGTFMKIELIGAKFFFLKCIPEDMFIDYFREIGRGWGGRERQRDKREIDQLHLTRALTRDQTANLGICPV